MIGRIDPSQTRMREPWLGEMPQLISQETYEEGGETWRARTSSGAEVLARRTPVPPRLEASAYLDRLRSLHQEQPPNLAPVVGGVERPDGIWILSRPIAAVPLRRLLEADLELAPALAVGLGVLEGLVALRRVRLTQRVDTDSVLVDTVGVARLDGSWIPYDEVVARDEVRAVGRLLCTVLGMPGRPADTLSPAERQAPALAAAARSLADGAIDDVASALALLGEAAGGLAAPAQLKRSGKLLTDSVRRLLSGQAPRPAAKPSGPAPAAGPGPSAVRPPSPAPGAPQPPQASPPGGSRLVPPPMPNPVAQGPAPRDGTSRSVQPPMPSPVPPARETRPAAAARPVPIGPRPSRESTWRAKPPPSRTRSGIQPAMVLAAAVLVVLLIAVVFVAFRALRSGGPSVATTPPAGQPSAPAGGQTTPPPGPPESAGDIQQVTLQLDQAQPCSPGDRACGLAVDVHLSHLLTGPEDVTWNFRVTNLCTGQTTTVESPSATVHAQSGWNHVTASSVIALPAAKRLQIVAATTAPAVAGSVPLTLGSPTC
jgi:hypothetical protein